MQIETVVTAIAETKSSIESTLGYLSHIILVEIIAGVALLA